MFFQNINKFSKEKAVLVVPLDWGLGHATRCIPLIKYLQFKGIRVLIGAEGSAKSLLEHEFQQITFINLRGYRIQYSRNRSLLPLVILLQVPKILRAVYQEQQWLKKVLKEYEVQAIISDNRFGLYHPSIPSIFITHQLSIKTGNTLTERLARQVNFWFIRKFKHCWVPDFEEVLNIAGELSHPPVRPKNVEYIGGVSRFTAGNSSSKDGLLILLSGPEPQRSIFEEVILGQLKFYTGNITLVRGLPGTTTPLTGIMHPGLTIKNHLNATELGPAISTAEWVICRSGYTTIMDLLKLRQRAILVPTPGQTEQEYLADHLKKQGYFFTVSQSSFNLQTVFQQATELRFEVPYFNMELYKKKLDQFVESL